MKAVPENKLEMTPVRALRPQASKPTIMALTKTKKDAELQRPSG
jgi:hypothetical protein